MTPKESIPTLQVTAGMLLPGMQHARSLLDVSIRVLQYFESQVARDAATGTAATLTAVPNLVKDAEQVKALLSAFGRLHGMSN
jgi:hypothetical protein